MAFGACLTSVGLASDAPLAPLGIALPHAKGGDSERGGEDDDNDPGLRLVLSAPDSSAERLPSHECDTSLVLLLLALVIGTACTRNVASALGPVHSGSDVRTKAIPAWPGSFETPSSVEQREEAPAASQEPVVGLTEIVAYHLLLVGDATCQKGHSRGAHGHCTERSTRAGHVLLRNRYLVPHGDALLWYERDQHIIRAKERPARIGKELGRALSQTFVWL